MSTAAPIVTGRRCLDDARRVQAVAGCLRGSVRGHGRVLDSPSRPDLLVAQSFADLPVLGAYSVAGFGAVRLGESAASRMTAPARAEHVVTVCLGSTDRVTQARLGETFVSPTRVGDAMMMPSGTDSMWEGRIPASLRLSINPDFLAIAAVESGVWGSKVPNVFRVRDPVLIRMAAIAVHDVLDESAVGRQLVTEGLANVLAGHLLSRYSAGFSATSMHGALPKAIQRAVQVINDRFAEDVSLQDLAEEARISRFHLSRLFREHMGISLIAYLQAVRLAEAKRLLRGGSHSLDEIARRVGFSTAHLTRLFQARTGETPIAWARRRRY